MNNERRDIKRKELLKLVEKKIDYSIREIADKSSATLIENIMQSIILTFDDEKKRELKFREFIGEICNARQSRLFGNKKEELEEVLRKVFKYDFTKNIIADSEIAMLSFEDKLMYYGFSRRWLKAYKNDVLVRANENLKKVQAPKSKENNYSLDNVQFNKLKALRDNMLKEENHR